MKADDKLYFMDGANPQHNFMPAYGWLEKRKTREIRSNSGRQGLNLNGALSLKDYEVVILEDESVNAQSTIKLLAELEEKNPDAETICCILDNARYYRALIVKEYLKTSKIELVFLPPYLPSLNLIERLWRFYRKKILYHRHYSNPGELKTVAIDYFF
jgi:transposase